ISKAFTLIELLVVIAIIAILIGLLIASVQKIREAMFRMSCANNLKQMGLALNNYHDTKNRFPLSGTADKSHSWNVFILPFMEQENLYNQYDTNQNWFDPINNKATQMQVKTFICPSSPEDQNRTAKDNKNPNAAITDYTVPYWVTDEFMLFSLSNGKGVAQTPFPLNLAVMNRQGIGTRISEIIDGTSNSFLVYESGGRPNHYIYGKIAGPSNVLAWDMCHNANVTNGIISGVAWADLANDSPVHGFNKNGTICSEACVINCTNNQEAYSFHTGGMNASFADGSVRYINENIKIVTFAALVTMAGGEVISEY
ncbi:MAG: DUF1559 domain-containing protein, partial [Gemmataceae bacterium]